jgi:uncharacterized protein YndB with AHSA1/START domain
MGKVIDRIDKAVRLRAMRERVWRAISDHREFGSWFGVRFEQAFVAGALMKGRIVPTSVDAEVARAQKPHEGAPFICTIERIQPQELFSFRWHPFAVEASVDYSQEPTTLVTFSLSDIPEGTLLQISETGFEGIPLARRAKAFTANDQGWTAQTRLIEKYLAMSAS